eukprot:gene1042-1105_t
MTSYEEELKIRELSASNRNCLVSGFIFPSYASVVEELAINALDAQARKIDILIDGAKLDIQIRDDGIGITEPDMRLVGLWHYTNAQKVGNRGQSLAALRTLCKSVEIVSKANEADSSWVKFMTVEEEELRQIDDSIKTGTIVTVKGAFHALPVRKNAIKMDVELTNIKTMVERLSVLHHDVTWTFREARYQRELVYAPAQPSVAKKVINTYGISVMTKMQSVCFVSDRFRLEGFLTPPTSDCCQSIQKIQLVYYNNRCIHSKDPIFLLLNKFYSEYFKKSSNDAGPVTMHANLDPLNCPKNPNFILKLTYLESDVNIIRDGDRVVPIFVNESQLESFLFDNLHNLFKKDYPDFSKSLQKNKRRTGQVSNLFGKKERLFSTIESSRTSKKQNDCAELTLDGSLFSFAFLPGSCTNTTMPATSKKTKQYPVKFDIDKEVRIERAQSRYENDEFAPSSSKRLNPSKRRRFYSEEQNHNINSLLQTYQVAPAQEFCVERCVSFEKSFLCDLKVIGQWDQKYILAIDKSSGNLVAFDQHAVDERIKYERLMKETVKKVSLTPPLTMIITPSERLVLETRATLFSSWSFEFSFLDEDDFYAESQTLQITCLPAIIEETLTLDDFREFCHFVEGNINLPDSSLQPPVIKRIVAYKACRGAIKFGDSLSLEQCTHLIHNLSSTTLPFQCAHGRPSIIPLADLHGLLDG